MNLFQSRHIRWEGLFTFALHCSLLLAALKQVQVEAINKTASQSLANSETQYFLEDITIPLTKGRFDAVVSVFNATCSNLIIDEFDVAVDVPEVKNQSNVTTVLNAFVNLLSFSIDCNFRYTYESALANGGGNAVIVTSANTMEADLRFTSPGTAMEEISAGACNAFISIDGIEFLREEPLATLFDSISTSPVVADKFAARLCDLVRNPVKLSALASKTNFSSSITKIATADPLLAEEVLKVPPGVELVDLLEGGEWPDWGVKAILEQGGPYLGCVSTHDEVQDLNINHLLRKVYIKDDGMMQLNLTNTTLFTGVDLLGQPSTLQIHSVRISGIDRFTKFDNFTTLSKHTVQMALAIESLEIRFLGDFEAESTVEEVEVILNVTNLEVVVAVLLAVDAVGLGEVPMGAFLDMDTIMTCFLSSLMRFQIADANIESLRLKPPTSPSAQRIKAAGITLTVTNVLDILVSMFSPSDETEDKAACVAARFSNPGTPYLDFRDLLIVPDEARTYGGSGMEPYGNLTSTVKAFLDDEFLTANETGEVGINSRLIAPFTEVQSGIKGKYEFNKALTLINRTSRGSAIDSQTSLTVERLTFEDLDSFRPPVALMDPMQGVASVLTNAMSIAPFRVGGVFNIAFVTKDLFQEKLELEIGLDLASFSVLFSLLANVSETAFLDFPIRDLFDLNCWLSTIPAPLEDSERTLSLLELVVAVGDVNLTLDCLECSVPSFEQITSQFSAATQSLNGRIEKSLSGLPGKDSLLQKRIDSWLVDASKRCRHHQDYDPEAQLPFVGAGLVPPSVSVIPTAMVRNVFLVGICFVVVGAFLYFGVGWIATSRHNVWLKTLPLASIVAIRDNQENERATEAKIDALAGSMFKNNHLSWFVRWLVPLALLGSSAFFLSGVLTDAAQANIYIQLVKEDLLILEFNFSFVRLASEMWKAGGRLLATMSVLLSMVWPHIKNFCTLILWFIPPSVLGTEKRFNCLWWLNAVGKWSVCIVFILIISTSAFRFAIESPVQSTAGQSLYRIELLIVPIFGLYLWSIGQVLAQVTGQVFMYHHRAVVAEERRRVLPAAETEYDMENSQSQGYSSGTKEAAEVEEKLPQDPSAGSTNGSELHSDFTKDPLPGDLVNLKRRRALHQEIFDWHHRDEVQQLRVRAWVNPAIVMMSVLAIGALIAGCILPSFSFDASGIIADAIPADLLIEKRSVFSLAQLLMSEARFIGTATKLFGIGLITAFFLVTVVAVPVLHLGTLLIQWFNPLQRVHMKKMHHVSELLQAWQYTEVFLLSSIACSIQLTGVSDFLIGRYCEILGNAIKMLVNVGLVEVDGKTCYAVTGSIEYGAVLLLTAVILVGSLRLFVAEAADQSFADQAGAVTKCCARAASGDGAPEHDMATMVQQINPPTIFFAHRFRLFLLPMTSS